MSRLTTLSTQVKTLKLMPPETFDSLLHTGKNFGIKYGFTYPEYASKNIDHEIAKNDLLMYSKNILCEQLNEKDCIPTKTTPKIYDTTVKILKTHNIRLILE